MALRGTETEILLADMGQRGIVFESGTTAITGVNFCKIVVVSAATFSAFTSKHITGDAMTQAFPAGTVIHGTTTAFTLSAGSVFAYKE